MPPDPTAIRVAAALGARVVGMEALGGGAAGTVSRVGLADGRHVVAKAAARGLAGLDAEARSLRLLAERSALPVPRVLHAEPSLLIMEEMPGRPGADSNTQAHAAELLSSLHTLTSSDDTEGRGRFGLSFDNTCGPLAQPNAWLESWPTFFRERRLLPLIHGGRLPSGLADRLGRIAARLDEILPAAPPPSLLHGDIWSGNVLSEGGRITAFLDPSPYYGHAEAELAFITLFSTFGPAFFGRYFERTGTPPGEQRAFFDTRRHVYNLYPLLVHTRLFGAAYAEQLSGTLRALGF